MGSNKKLEASVGWAGNFSKRYDLGSVSLERTVQSNVTTAWGVEWDEGMIARDLLQNFFDANRRQVHAVRVETDGRTVTVSAPAEFPLESLFYLGSTKGADDIGQYGEGFKAAAMCLLRDHKVTPIVISGDRMVRITVSDVPVPELGLYCLVYDFYALSTLHPGTILILPDCPPNLIAAMRGGMSNFYFGTNPLLGDLLWSDWQGRFSLYESADDSGHVFYSNLKRGEIAGIPAVIVIHKTYAEIEKKIGKDRDRTAFGDELLDLFYKTVAERGFAGELSAIRHLLSLATDVWERGHPLLARVASRCIRQREGKYLADLFGDGYYAESHFTHNVAEQLRRREIEETWKREGRRHLPGYFTAFGVPSAQTHLEDVEEEAKRESRTRLSRPPSLAEQRALDVLHRAVGDFSPVMALLLANKACKYTVAETETVQGELKKSRTYNSSDVFLAYGSFEEDFSDAMALFLHEHSHVFGYDGSRGFTDALTALLATVVRCRAKLDEYEKLWDAARDAVQAERVARESVDGIGSQIAQLSDSELRELVRLIPPAVIRSTLTEIQAQKRKQKPLE